MTTFHSTSGSTEPMELDGETSAVAQAGVDKAAIITAVAAIQAATPRARYAFRSLACQKLPAINHPRYSDGILWLDRFGSGKRFRQTSKNTKQIPAMPFYDEWFAKQWRALDRGPAHWRL
ncbi:hypothetical protein [Bradyrhizobium sp. STM 3809]|uniref:hypothetical protein n=1 Tax=Bradyrhizobium sp. STM 3809 TaxID=551936 RepID=UPI001F0A2648|nr:hypothetical protein [Bradyrhizobium sp. STM 3809]